MDDDQVEVAKTAACLRHSYPRGTKAGSGRLCQRCGHVDGENQTPSSSTATSTPAVESFSASVTDGTVAIPEQEILPPLPEHSPLGASSSERWMNCSGSAALVEI